MPFISTTPKKEIENQYTAIRMLEEKCESCKLFRGKVAESVFTYSVYPDYMTKDGPAMLAIACFGNNTYAIYAPDYLTDKQLVIFDFLLMDKDIDDKDTIVVFSTKSYNALKDYSRGKPINVKLHV